MIEDGPASRGRPRIGQTAGTKEYRRFGLLVGGIFLLLGIWPLAIRHQPARPSLLLAGSALGVLALVAPVALRPVHKVWMMVGALLGWINTRVILALVFYVIVTPLGLVLRACGKDPIRTSVPNGSYRLARSPRRGSHMLRQF